MKTRSTFRTLLLTLLVAPAFAFMSGDNGKTRTVKAVDYMMDIPQHMKSTRELNDEASLQYQDPAAELYIIVIDESKSEFIKTFKEIGDYNDSFSVVSNYSRVQLNSMIEKLRVTEGPFIEKGRVIHGMDAEVDDFKAYAEGIDESIYYKFAFIEGDKNMYMVMTWTLASRKKTHLPEMNGMIYSFRMQE